MTKRDAKYETVASAEPGSGREAREKVASRDSTEVFRKETDKPKADVNAGRREVLDRNRSDGLESAKSRKAILLKQAGWVFGMKEGREDGW